MKHERAASASDCTILVSGRLFKSAQETLGRIFNHRVSNRQPLFWLPPPTSSAQTFACSANTLDIRVLGYHASEQLMLRQFFKNSFLEIIAAGGYGKRISVRAHGGRLPVLGAVHETYLLLRQRQRIAERHGPCHIPGRVLLRVLSMVCHHLNHLNGLMRTFPRFSLR